MNGKRDWVKTTAVILAVIFFIFWIIAANDNSYVLHTNSDIATICNVSIENTLTICKATIQSLHNQWQSSLDTLLNCYENNVPKCNYSTPTLNPDVFN